ncbi:MAG: hypothetical protein ABSD29_05745 [Verrucomicrobiota bacterium]
MQQANAAQIEDTLHKVFAECFAGAKKPFPAPGVETAPEIVPEPETKPARSAPLAPFNPGIEDLT